MCLVLLFFWINFSELWSDYSSSSARGTSFLRIQWISKHEPLKSRSFPLYAFFLGVPWNQVTRLWCIEAKGMRMSSLVHCVIIIKTICELSSKWVLRAPALVGEIIFKTRRENRIKSIFAALQESFCSVVRLLRSKFKGRFKFIGAHVMKSFPAT